jgi:hypothetical protein
MTVNIAYWARQLTMPIEDRIKGYPSRRLHLLAVDGEDADQFELGLLVHAW